MKAVELGRPPVLERRDDATPPPSPMLPMDDRGDRPASIAVDDVRRPSSISFSRGVKESRFEIFSIVSSTEIFSIAHSYTHVTRT